MEAGNYYYGDRPRDTSQDLFGNGLPNFSESSGYPPSSQSQGRQGKSLRVPPGGGSNGGGAGGSFKGEEELPLPSASGSISVPMHSTPSTSQRDVILQISEADFTKATKAGIITPDQSRQLWATLSQRMIHIHSAPLSSSPEVSSYSSVSSSSVPPSREVVLGATPAAAAMLAASRGVSSAAFVTADALKALSHSTFNGSFSSTASSGGAFSFFQSQTVTLDALRESIAQFKASKQCGGEGGEGGGRVGEGSRRLRPPFSHPSSSSAAAAAKPSQAGQPNAPVSRGDSRTSPPHTTTRNSHTSSPNLPSTSNGGGGGGATRNASDGTRWSTRDGARASYPSSSSTSTTSPTAMLSFDDQPVGPRGGGSRAYGGASDSTLAEASREDRLAATSSQLPSSHAREMPGRVPPTHANGYRVDHPHSSHPRDGGEMEEEEDEESRRTYPPFPSRSNAGAGIRGSDGSGPKPSKVRLKENPRGASGEVFGSIKPEWNSDVGVEYRDTPPHLSEEHDDEHSFTTTSSLPAGDGKKKTMRKKVPTKSPTHGNVATHTGTTLQHTPKHATSPGTTTSAPSSSVNGKRVTKRAAAAVSSPGAGGKKSKILSSASSPQGNETDWEGEKTRRRLQEGMETEMFDTRGARGGARRGSLSAYSTRSSDDAEGYGPEDGRSAIAVDAMKVGAGQPCVGLGDAVREPLAPCRCCGRTFRQSLLTRHESLCRNQQKPRRAFNMKQQRLEGLDGLKEAISHAKYNAQNKSLPKAPGAVGDMPKWKVQHEQFQAAMRAAHMYKLEQERGGKGGGGGGGPGLGGGGSGAGLASSSSAMAAFPAPPDDRVPCPHCGRKFAPETAERHIPHCANTVARPRGLTNRPIRR